MKRVGGATPALGARPKASFLLSVWLEPGADGAEGGRWRGSVEHLRSGDRLYFNQMANLIGFLSDWLETATRTKPDGI